ncbi:hypothetical protein LBMAG27_17440 [Bacteroidota bacterium]|nr:hypothetical protein LBMAG27_17440 [Bacteroidota bacterium]
MQKNLHFTALVLMIVSLFFFSCNRTKNAYAQNESFEQFKKLFTESIWKNNPDWALALGNHEYDERLEIPSKENRIRKLDVYKSLSDSLKKYDWKKITPENSIDARIMMNYLEEYNWSCYELKSFEWNPAEYNVGEGFDLILGNSKVSLEKRLLVISERLKYVPEYYIVAKANMHKPTKEHTELGILQNKGSLEIFEKNIPDSLNASKLSNEEKTELKGHLAQALSSMKEYIQYLTEVQKTINKDSTATSSFRLGKVLYEKKFRFEMQSCFSVDEIFQKAKDHKTEIHTEMNAITKKLWPKYFGSASMPEGLTAVKMMIDTLSHQHCAPDSFIATIKKQIPQLEAFIKQKNLITLDDSKPLEVRETPMYMRGGGAGASINAPGPYDKNAKTFYNVTPLDGYTPDEAESYLREYNNWILQILNIHEALPGHYAQLVYSNKVDDIIKSVFQNNGMIEGWAVYGERMMLEEGYGNNEPEMWLMYYKWHLRSTLNTILDYSIQCLNMSKEDAVKLLTQEGFQTASEAEGKWRRATLTQTQLCCYFTGYTEIYALREDQKKQLGADFSLKNFNEKFLSYGSVPVKYIWEMMKSGEKN